MVIENNGIAYSVNECVDHWELTKTCGKVTLCVNVAKSLASTFEGLQDYLNNNKIGG